MLLSEILLRGDVTDPDAIAKKLARYGGDFDVHQRLAKRANQMLVERAEGAQRALLAQIRGYTKDSVSTPVVPGFAVEYDPLAEFVADQVCPYIPGNIQRKFPTWSRRDASRLQNLEIGSDGRIPEAAANIAFTTYQEKPYGEKQRIDNNAVAQAPDTLDLYAHHERLLMGDILRMREYRVATLIGTSANYAAGCTSALAGTNRWDVGAATSTADPIKDIKITAMAGAAVGKRPNVLAASTPVLEYLRTHPKVVASAGSTATARVASDDDLKRIFGLSAIIEGKAKYDAQGNVVSAGSYAYIWGKFCALLYIQPGMSVMDQSWCKTFRHTPLAFRDAKDDTTGVRGMSWLIGTHEDAEVVTASDCGYLLDTVIS